MHSGSSKLHEQSVLRHVIRKASGSSLQTHIRSCTAMPYNSVMNSILSADHGCSGRKARCIRAVIIIEPYSLLCNFIHSHNSPYDPPAAYQYQTVILSFVSCSFSPFFITTENHFLQFSIFPRSHFGRCAVIIIMKMLIEIIHVGISDFRSYRRNLVVGI